MTCQRIYIPQKSKESKNGSIPENTPKEEKTEPVHRPEIVSGRNTYTDVVDKKKGVFRISLGKVITVAVLCSASFAVGCTVTNERLAEFMGNVAGISSGNTRHGGEYETDDVAENITFYEKYMSEEDKNDSDDNIQYLSSGKITGEIEPMMINEPQTEDVAVSVPVDGKIGADGEVLYSVFSADLSVTDVHSLNNQTSYSPDTYALISKTPKALENLELKQGEPLVLVVHTHGTECYNSYENPDYTSVDTAVRSVNTEENVVSIGKKIVSVLADFGIPAVHSEKMCDKESFVNAYSTSYNEVKAYLEKYPSIRFVIDLHRDAIEHNDGSKTKPVYDDFGNKSAQLMFVVGTNKSGINHPNWQDNLSLALTLQEKIGRDNPKLFRRINLRTASFNQQLSPGYLLLECGAAANTLEEAENAAELFATGFARVISEYAVNG